MSDPILLAADPGNQESAFARITIPDDKAQVPDVLGYNKINNDDFMDLLLGKDVPEPYSNGWGHFDYFVAECPFPRGQMMTTQLIATIMWLGELTSTVKRIRPEAVPDDWQVDRGKVKYALCGRTASVGDPQVRQALISIYGGEDKAIGGKKCRTCKGKGWVGRGRPTCERCNGECWDTQPGPLNTMSKDTWAALGVGITWIKARHNPDLKSPML